MTVDIENELEEANKELAKNQTLLLKAHRKIGFLERELMETNDRCVRYKKAYNDIQRATKKDSQAA